MKLDLGLSSTAPQRWRRLFAAGLLVASSSAVGCAEEPIEGETEDEAAESPDELEARGDGRLDIGDFFPWRRDGGSIFGRRDGGFGRRDAGGSTPPADAGTPSRDSGTPKPDAGGGGGGNDALWCNVQPIFEKSCAGCHDGNGTAGTPMGLSTYSDFTAPNPSTPNKKVYEQVFARVHDTARPMPPRGLLPAADLAKIDAWVKAGAPGSDETDCSGEGHEGGGHTPGNPDPNDGWDPTKCDAIYEIRAHAPNSTAPYNVPVGNEYHPQIAVPAPWGNERVQAIAFRPITDNAKVLHHWILYGGSGLSRAFLTGWAPGDDVRPPYPEDVGMDMPSTLTLDMHYYNKGAGAKPELDRSGLEVCVLKGNNLRPKTAAVSMGLMSIGQGGILAPRGANMTPQTGTCNVQTTQPVHIMTAAPHAHKYARRMKFVVKKKNGKEIVMHDAPFNFGEQGTYAVPGGEVIVETGDVITTTCYYTNTTNKDIRFGESTESEMCFNFALYYPKGALSCGGGLFGGTGVANPFGGE